MKAISYRYESAGILAAHTPAQKCNAVALVEARRGLNRAGVARIGILIRVPVGQILRINIGLCAFDALSFDTINPFLRRHARSNNGNRQSQCHTSSSARTRIG
jgi:hypothetical protein